MISAWLLSIVLSSAAGASGSGGVTDIKKPVADYLLNCGGCHGILGSSSDHAVPSLRGQVDAFLCLPEGREYLVRLPNVAFAPLSDADLAALMNFVVSLGARLTESPPYTADEVSALRRRSFLGEPIGEYRREIVQRLIAACGAPRSLLLYR